MPPESPKACFCPMTLLAEMAGPSLTGLRRFWPAASSDVAVA